MSSSRSATLGASGAPGAAFDFTQLEGSPQRRPPSVPDAAVRARAIVAAAEAEADRIRSEAAQQGYGEGFEAGRAEARSELEPALRTLSEAVDRVPPHQIDAGHSVQPHAVGLSR